MFHKRLFFISKGLQLIQRITVNGAVLCTSETSGTNSSLLLITHIQNFISGKLQSSQRVTKSFFTSKKKITTISKAVLHIGQHLVKAKTTRKIKRRKRRRRKRKKRRKRKEKEGEGEREKRGGRNNGEGET